jgi:two-component system nitrate/nitrite response regulator NarL
MDPVSVLVVDSHPAVLDAVTRFLREGCQGEVIVVGVARDGQEALAQAGRLQPQVILLDPRLPGLPGLKAIPLLRGALPGAGIIVLTLMDTDAHRQAALASGADDFVSKSSIDTDLLPAIRRAARSGRGPR